MPVVVCGCVRSGRRLEVHVIRRCRREDRHALNSPRSFVLRPLSVVAVERKVPQKDLAQFRLTGVSRRRLSIWFRSSQPVAAGPSSKTAAELFDLDTTEAGDRDFIRPPFERITRPQWPFDPDLEQP